MQTQKILIDPMTPFYQRVKFAVANRKGGKAFKTRSSSPQNAQEDPQSAPIELTPISDTKSQENNRMKDIYKEAEQDGIREAMKETIKEKSKNTFKLYGLINKSEKVVHKIKNIVPLLPGEIIIDTSKVTFIHRPFFFSERIHSISIKDVTDVYVETAPFFATLNIVDANFVENVVRLNWFWKKDAERARRIITGLMEASKEQVDLKNIEDEALVDKLEEIGKARATKTSVSQA